MKEEYKEILKVIYEENNHTKNKDIFVSALINIETGCSFDDDEYITAISTGSNFMDHRDTDLITECIGNDLKGCIGKIPEEENIVIDMVDDGEQEDMHYNRYFTIKKVSILTLEELKSNPVKEILDYLNEAKRKLTGNDSLRGFRETPAVKVMINARLKETFTVEDFKMVIDYKCQCWKDDKKMQEYIRPSTLFKASHFSEYLCESEGNKNNLIETNIPETPQTAEEIYNRMAKEAGK